MSEQSDKLISAIKNKGKTLEAEMSFFDHLEALRWHLIRASIVIVVITCFVFAFYDWIFDTVIMGPSKPDFWTYRTMCDVGNAIGRNFCFSKFNINLINTEMAGQFTLQINSSLLIGITLGVPYLLWEIWRFIKPALHEKERKAATGFVSFTSLLFFIGILFGYYVITPMSLHFLATYTVSSSIQNLFTIDSYISSVATIASGLVFELPILIYVLASLGIMTPKFMRSSRRYAIVVILVIAAVVTPTPDMLTMTIVSIPLFVLYEVSIVVAAVVEKRKIKKSEEILAP